MLRWVPVLALSLLLIACSSSKPAAPEVDPVTDPTIIGAVDEAVLQGSAEAAAMEPTARRIGRVAGVLAAVLGGPESESLDDMVERYRITRDATIATTVGVAATKAAGEGAKRGLEMDQQFAELHQLEGIEVMHPYPDLILVYLPSSPDPELLASVAAVFQNREPRAIDVIGAGDAALNVRDVLIASGVPESSFNAIRDDEIADVVIRIGYR